MPVTCHKIEQTTTTLIKILPSYQNSHEFLISRSSVVYWSQRLWGKEFFLLKMTLISLYLNKVQNGDSVGDVNWSNTPVYFVILFIFSRWYVLIRKVKHGFSSIKVCKKIIMHIYSSKVFRENSRSLSISQNGDRSHAFGDRFYFVH